jgi:DNA-binding MarR family transcriptional regulator
VRLPDRPADLPNDERHEIANLLHSAALRLLRRVRAVDLGMDLDGPRASLLSVVVFAGPQPVTRLAAIEQVTPPAITKLVTALEADGLVARERSPDDRRVVLVGATAAGRRLLEQGRAARVRAMADVLDGASAQELATLRHAADIIARRLADARSSPLLRSLPDRKRR